MSAVNHLVLRRAALLSRSCHLNSVRQALVPFSTTSHALADTTNTDETSTKTGSKSFDSVPVHLGPLGKMVMVLGGLYPRYADVPDTIPNRAYQKTKDKFRARCVVLSLLGTALLGFVAANRGRKARDEGKRYTDDIYRMHRGESRLHEQLEKNLSHRRVQDRYSPPVDEVNK